MEGNKLHCKVQDQEQAKLILALSLTKALIIKINKSFVDELTNIGIINQNKVQLIKKRLIISITIIKTINIGKEAKTI